MRSSRSTYRDYKVSAERKKFGKMADEQLGETSLQIPLYLLLARAHVGEAGRTARLGGSYVLARAIPEKQIVPCAISPELMGTATPGAGASILDRLSELARARARGASTSTRSRATRTAPSAASAATRSPRSRRRRRRTMHERGATEEQLAAIRVVGSAAVRAGAGAGKTRVLSEHFLHLLRGEDGNPPPVEQVSEILAIAFTEKAAAEMKTKLRQLLAEAAQAPAAERPRWERARRELLGAQISTIHSFCAASSTRTRSGRRHPAAAVLDEHESRAWLETVVEEALAAPAPRGEPRTRALLLTPRPAAAAGTNATAVAVGSRTAS